LQALIFDVDGTLAETEEAHRAAFNAVFAEQGLDWSWDRRVYSRLLSVAGGKERIRHFLAQFNPADGARFLEDDGLVRAMHRRKTEIYTQMVSGGEVALRPGVERLIREARAKGVRLAIATTTNPAPLAALFKGTLGEQALDWFEAIAAGDMVKNKKPASDVYRLALDRLGLQGGQCLALEDTRNGVKSALAAGVPTVVTVSAYSDGQDFSGALAVLDNLGEPDAPFRQASGPDAAGSGVFDLALARRWHSGVLA